MIRDDTASRVVAVAARADPGSGLRERRPEPGFTPPLFSPVLPADLEGTSYGVADLEHTQTNGPAGVHICGTIDTAGCGSSLTLVVDGPDCFAETAFCLVEPGREVCYRRIWIWLVSIASQRSWSLGGTLPSCIGFWDLGTKVRFITRSSTTQDADALVIDG